jgi:hypothetical protein
VIDGFHDLCGDIQVRHTRRPHIPLDQQCISSGNPAAMGNSAPYLKTRRYRSPGFVARPLSIFAKAITLLVAR